MNFLLHALFFFVFALPRSLFIAKIVIIAALIFMIIIREKQIKVNYQILILPFLVLMPATIVGLLENNDISLLLNSLKLNYLFPIFLYLLLKNYNKTYISSVLITSATYALAFGFVLNLSSLLFLFGYIPFNPNGIFYPNEQFVGYHDGYIHIVNSSFSYWIYIVPLIYLSVSKNRIYATLAMILSFIMAFVSGRRVLMLPYLFILAMNITSWKKILASAFILFLVIRGLSSIPGIDAAVVADRFVSAIERTGDSEVRDVQKFYFQEYIKERPMLGYGFGAYMTNYIRNDEFKTAYENTLDYLVFERGIIGALLYFVLITYLYYKIYKSDESVMFKKSLLLATTSILVASYTNPYWLSSFDYTIPYALLLRFSDKA